MESVRLRQEAERHFFQRGAVSSVGGGIGATWRLRDPVPVSLNSESSPLATKPIAAPLVLLPRVMLAFLPTPVAGMNG